MTNKRYELGPTGATVTPESLWVGLEEFLWHDVLAAGVSYRTTGSHVRVRVALLHFAYDDGSAAGRREHTLSLQGASAVNQEFVADVRSRVADRWVGDGGYYAMRKRLGFSNRGAFLRMAGLLLFVLAVFGVLLAVSHAERQRPVRRPATAQGGGR